MKDLEQFGVEHLKEMLDEDINPLNGFSSVPNYWLHYFARIALEVKQAKPVAYLVHEKAKPARLSFQNIKGFVSQSDIEEHELWQEVLYTTPQPAHTEQVIPDGWKLVPIEPTEDMVINGFESEPDKSFTHDIDWDAYDAMSGCEQAAHRAKLCWAAMLASSPKPE